MKNKNVNLNIPNLLSFLRILLIAPFVTCYLTDHTVWAWVMLGLSGISDFLDGKIARSFHQITDLGKVLDPVADKLTQGAVAVCLAVKQPMLWPLLGIFVLKELLMLIAGLILIKKKKRPCAAKWYGKVATILFYVSFVTIFALKAIWHYESMTLTGILLSVTAGFMIYAFLRYFQVFVHILRSDDPKDSMHIQLRQKEPGERSETLEKLEKQAASLIPKKPIKQKQWKEER